MLHEVMDLLKEENLSVVFLKVAGWFYNPSCPPQSATLGSQRRFSLVDYSLTRTLAMREPAKKAGSKIGS